VCAGDSDGGEIEGSASARWRVSEIDRVGETHQQLGSSIQRRALSQGTKKQKREIAACEDENRKRLYSGPLLSRLFYTILGIWSGSGTVTSRGGKKDD
jgi:hypothetical protein